MIIFCTIRLVRICHSRCCSPLSTRSCRLHSCILSARFLTTSSFAFVASLPLWPRPGCADSPCASCAPPDRLVPLRVSPSSVLSVASCNVPSFTVPCLGILLRSPGCTSHRRVHSRDRLLWLFAAHVSSTVTCLMLSRHPSLCSLTSAPICAVLHTSLESPPAGCSREYAFCALLETTLCASRESSAQNFLSLKAVLSSRLRDSTTVWSAEAFNTTGVVVVHGKTSCVPSPFLSCTAAWPSTHASEFWQYWSCAECCETSLSHLPRSLRAPSTSEPSRSLTPSTSLARATHHHVLDLALLHPTDPRSKQFWFPASPFPLVVQPPRVFFSSSRRLS